MIAKRYNGPCGWEHPASDSKKPWMFFCHSNGHVFQTMRTKSCQESAAKLSDLDSAESHGRLDAAHCFAHLSRWLAAITVFQTRRVAHFLIGGRLLCRRNDSFFHRP